VTSRPVAQTVRERLSLPETPDLSELVTVQAVGTSRILRITARDTDPNRAARTANTVANGYLKFRQEDSMGRYERASERLAEEQAEIESRLEAIDSQLGRNQGKQVDLEAERRTLLIQLAQIMAQMDDLNDSLTSATAGGELVRAADPPTTPVSPRPGLNIFLGLLSGLLLGAGAALLRDRFDDIVHDEEAAQQALAGAVVLGRVPRWTEQPYRGRLVALLDPHAPATEEYQRLGVNVRFMLAPVRESRSTAAVVLTTSAQEGEGKTVTACNLAVAAARLGLRVVLLDADLRRASVAPRFGVGDPPGLSDMLAGGEFSDLYLIDVGVLNLRVLAAGTIPPNPAALLTSGRMQTVLSRLTADADLVVIDSPPVLIGADTLELANHADMVMVVARPGVSRRRQLASALESLRHVGVHAVGAVYNGLGDQSRRTYAYKPRERATQLFPVPSRVSGNGRPRPQASSAPMEDRAPVNSPDVSYAPPGKR